jgi:predicted alpha/beta-fold hydrolase
MKLALVLRKKELVDKDYFREIFVFQEDGGQIALDYYKPAWINLLNKKDIKSIMKEEKEEKEKVNATPHF